MSASCRHCDRDIYFVDGAWIDPEADGDDTMWRETCDQHDTFGAEHEPLGEADRWEDAAVIPVTD